MIAVDDFMVRNMFYIFLDRCAVIAIRNYIDGEQCSQTMIDRLESFDVQGNVVSIMPALMEGNRTFLGNIDEWRRGIEEEIRMAQEFFKNV